MYVNKDEEIMQAEFAIISITYALYDACYSKIIDNSGYDYIPQTLSITLGDIRKYVLSILKSRLHVYIK